MNEFDEFLLCALTREWKSTGMIAASMTHGSTTYIWMRETCWDHLTKLEQRGLVESCYDGVQVLWRLKRWPSAWKAMLFGLSG